MIDTLKRLLSPGGWAALLGAIALLVLVLFVMGRCSRGDEVREAKADRAMADARTQSATEAITEIGRLDDRGAATESQVKEAQDAIRQADPADRDRVARAHLCRLQHRPDCDRVQ
jgi:hypothetical protein